MAMEGQNVPAPTGGFFIPRTACNFSEESFFLISFCYSVMFISLAMKISD
jgi:hypothetical protein